MKKVTYQLWVGDNLILADEDDIVVIDKYNSIPSGKGQAPSKRRALLMVETVMDDN